MSEIDEPVVIEHLRHSYGKHRVYDDLSLSFETGKVYGLLGKNGVGKTTLIKILMGFLRPQGGQCRVFGDPAHAIRPATRARVGLLFERHLTYEFFSIKQVERFYAGFYPGWRRDIYYDMVGRLRLPDTHIIGTMSEGQRSQVVLGLMLAQNPELLILDDYSMGLDAGYRRLFVDYLREFFKDGKHTVILTSHVIQDMESFVDEIVFLERGGNSLRTSMSEFTERFSLYRLPKPAGARGFKALDDAGFVAAPQAGQAIKNVEEYGDHWDIFSFAPAESVTEALREQGFGALVPPTGLEKHGMNLEDAFIGYTGRY